MNRTIKDATVKRLHYETHGQLRSHFTNVAAADDFAKRLTLNGLTPYEFMSQAHSSLNPIHQMPGLDI